MDDVVKMREVRDFTLTFDISSPLIQALVQLFHSSPDGFALHQIICDQDDLPVDYRFIAVNPAFELQTSLKSHDLIGKTVLSIIPNLEKFWIERYGKVAMTGQPVNFQDKSIPLGRDFKISAFSPAPGLFVTIVTDITDIKKNQERIRLLNETIFSIRSRGSFNIEPLISLCCQSFSADSASYKKLEEDLLIEEGVYKKEAAACDFANSKCNICIDLIEDRSSMTKIVKDIPSIFPKDHRLVEQGFVTYFGHQIMVNGKIVGVLCTFYKKKADFSKEDIQYMGLIAQAISFFEEQNENNRRLLHKNWRLGCIIKATNSGTWEWNIQTGETIFNNQWAEMLGYDQDELGRTTIESWEKLVHPSDLHICKDALEKHIAGESPFYSSEYRMRHKDGHYLWISDRGEIMTWTDAGKPLLAFGVHVNIDDKIKSFAEREKLQEQLLQSQKLESVGRLAGGVAHDFNNMLSIISGHVEIGLSSVTRDDVAYEHLLSINAAAVKAGDLTRQLLGFARLQNISPRFLDFNSTVESTLKMLRRLIGENIDLIWQPGNDIWPIIMDPTQIDQILVNLVINARDAIGANGTISLYTENGTIDRIADSRIKDIIPGDYVILSVIDDGCGMNKEVQDKLFEPFFTTKEMGRGTGLGLATVYGIVKQNKGCLSVYSEINQGTTIKVYLPVALLKSSAASVNSINIKEESDSEKTTSSYKGNIIVVEDEQEILSIVKMMLENFGHKVMAFSHHASAIKYVKECDEKIDLLITDMIMPGINGKDLYFAIKQNFPKIKCLFMSGYTPDIVASSRLFEKDTKFLQKPFTMRILRDTVDQMLGEENG